MEKYKIELNKGSSKYLQIYNYIKKLIIDNDIKERGQWNICFKHKT